MSVWKCVFFVCFLLATFDLIDSRQRNYWYIKNENTQRYLLKNGKLASSIRDYNGLYDIVTDSNGKTIFYTYNGVPKSAMDISNGCLVNSPVKGYPFSGSTNQYWYINNDGTIGTACNLDWILTYDSFYTTMLKPRSEVGKPLPTWTIENNTWFGFQSMGCGVTHAC